ncbi:MAG: hypothetical protein H0Z33_10280 [Bacillaceae bacterium]|nr:hypothetical protein [Bacillaceae bacterium]
MIVSFKNDDRAYEKWLRKHPDGYVFNHFGGPDSRSSENKVHAAGCRHLLRKQDEGKRTATYAKVCSSDLDELLAYVKEVRRDSWSYCKNCLEEVQSSSA